MLFKQLHTDTIHELVIQKLSKKFQMHRPLKRLQFTVLTSKTFPQSSTLKPKILEPSPIHKDNKKHIRQTHDKNIRTNGYIRIQQYFVR